jgi:hypothetical protein
MDHPVEARLARSGGVVIRPVTPLPPVPDLCGRAPPEVLTEPMLAILNPGVRPCSGTLSCMASVSAA